MHEWHWDVSSQNDQMKKEESSSTEINKYVTRKQYLSPLSKKEKEKEENNTSVIPMSPYANHSHYLYHSTYLRHNPLIEVTVTISYCFKFDKYFLFWVTTRNVILYWYHIILLSVVSMFLVTPQSIMSFLIRLLLLLIFLHPTFSSI